MLRQQLILLCAPAHKKRGIPPTGRDASFFDPLLFLRERFQRRLGVLYRIDFCPSALHAEQEE